MILLRLLGYLWSLPVTLAGLLVALVGGAVYVGTGYGALLFISPTDSLLRRHFFDRFGMAAFTWGAVIIRRTGQDLSSVIVADRLYRHEAAHTRQAMVFGPLMPIAYGVCSLWAWVRGGNPYRDNALEAMARRAER